MNSEFVAFEIGLQVEGTRADGARISSHVFAVNVGAGFNVSTGAGIDAGFSGRGEQRQLTSAVP